MFCGKCGTQVSDDAVFCGNCGYRFDQEPVAETAPAVEEVVTPATEEGFAQPEFPAPKPKKSRIGLVIGALVAVAAVLVVAFFGQLKGFAVRTFAGDAAYFRYVMQKAVSGASGDISETYGNLLDGLYHTKGQDAEVKLSFSEKAHDLVKQYTQMDTGWLSDISFEIESAKDGDLTQAVSSLKLGDKGIADIIMLTDVRDGNVYLNIQNLTDKYLLMKADMSEEDRGVVNMFSDAELEKILPNDKKLDELINKYLGIAVRNINHVEKSKYALYVGNVEQQVTKLEVSIDQQTVVDILRAVLNEVKQDKQIKEMLDDMDQYLKKQGYLDESESLYTSMIDGVNEGLETLGEIEVDTPLLVNLYVDGSDEIVGLGVGNNGSEYVYAKTAADGKNFATSVNLGMLTIEGNGTQSGDKKTGTYAVSAAGGKEIVSFTLTDFDVEAMTSGEPTGSVKIVPSFDTLADMFDIPNEAVSIISMLKPAVELDFDCSDKKTYVKFGLLSNDELLFSIETTAKKTNGGKVKEPQAENVIDQENAEKWAESIDFNKLIDALKKAGVPSNLVQLLESSLGETLDVA